VEDTLLREQYKTVRILRQDEHYVCAQAVDILDREKRSCLLNLYGGPLLRTYLPCFQNLSGHEGFLNVFLDGGRLAAVFDDTEGTPIDAVFYRGDRHSRQDRLDWADALMKQVLSLADIAPEIACSVLLSENVMTVPDEKQIRLRFAVCPMEGTNSREAALLAGDQLKKILRPGWESPIEELDFLDELNRGEYLNIVKLYALWTRRREAIAAAYGELEKKNCFHRMLILTWRRIRRKLAQRG
jgi:hypothetical protein